MGKFFSSPGGMKVVQDDKMKVEDSVQMYDYDAVPEEVTMAKLDDVLMQKSLRVPNIQSVRLIKIDVEGMEKEVILGSLLAIQQFRPIIWTENVSYFESNGTDTSFLQIMNQFQYDCGKAQNSPNDLVCTSRQGFGGQQLYRDGEL